MRRMIAFLLCGFIVFLLKGGKLPDLTVFDQTQRIVVILGKEREDFGDAVQNGGDFYYTFDDERKIEILGKLSDLETLKGVNLYFSKELPLSYFQERLDYLGRGGDVEGAQVYYGFFKNFHKFELVNGKKVNVQLVYNDEGWVMGFPIILTGF